uniref:Maturation protein n=1 Tax=Hubei levi-like virus 14 TaxID=1922913 RepID=A0A1L3KIK8_9VIRU|nr:hypothetical protein [Hubei levi-like virus 14]
MKKRIRDMSRMLPPVQGLHGNWHPTTGWQGTPMPHVAQVKSVDYMEDVVTPDFARLSARGKVVNNPMFRRKSAVQFTGGTYAVYRTSQGSTLGYRREGSWGAELIEQFPNLHLDPRISRLKTLAITEAYSKVGEMDLEGLVSLAEMRETAAFLASPIGKLRTLTQRWNRISQLFADDEVAYRTRLEKWNKLPPRVQARRKPPKLRQRKVRFGGVSVTDISSLWLAYRYGIMPLFYDIKGVIALLERQYGEVRLTARAKQATTWEDEKTAQAGPYGFQDVYQYSRKTKAIVTVRAGVLYAAKTTVASAAGLTLDRLPGAIWELVPLSFVVDWFLNIGDVLNALTSHARGEILAAWVTVKVDYTVRNVISSASASGENAISVSALPSYDEDGVIVERLPITLLDIGVRGQFDMNLKRYIDALALIHQSLAQNSKLLSSKLDFSRKTPRKPT